MVLTVIEGVVKEVPVLNKVPPVEASYQFNTPALADAERITVPGPQRNPGVVLLIVRTLLIVASTELRVDDMQLLSLAST